MSDTKENTTAEKKEQAAPKDKTTSAAQQEKEKSVWEKAAETIAGDNKLMETVLKIVLSPITLLAGAGLIVFCFFKIKQQKEDIEKLKAENKKLSDEQEIKEEEYHKLKKKHKKMKELYEPENNVKNLGSLPHKTLSEDSGKNKIYHSTYLD